MVARVVNIRTQLPRESPANEVHTFEQWKTEQMVYPQGPEPWKLHVQLVFLPELKAKRGGED